MKKLIAALDYIGAFPSSTKKVAKPSNYILAKDQQQPQPDFLEAAAYISLICLILMSLGYITIMSVVHFFL